MIVIVKTMAMVAINTKEIVEVSQRMIGSTRMIVIMKAMAMWQSSQKI